GFKSIQVVEREKNWGLSNNIISGVTEIVNKYGKIIVLEDDLLLSPYFLTFMNEALTFYQNEEKVISIHGYTFPVRKKLAETFFIKGADCWGWATWKRGWDLFNPDGTALMKELKDRKLIKDFDFNYSYPYYKMLTKQTEGKNDSWAVRWYASAFLNNKLTLYPNRSLIFYNGNDRSGTNSNNSDEFKVDLSSVPVVLKKIEVRENKDARKAFIHYFRYTRLIRKIIFRLKKLFHKK
ncbi:MAG: glycosyltransferase family 2 protein, partial [Tannerella sp.]|nr:glycosyltransferase family 2 protein [Tannerella sp.]